MTKYTNHVPFYGIVALLVALVLAAFESSATVVVMHSIEEMSQRADIIAHVRVAEQRTVSVDGRILTFTGIEVIDGYKNAKAGDALQIYQVGGTFEGRTAKIAGAHEHVAGEEMVLFAMRHRENVVSYGVGVGKFRVEYDGGFVKVIEDLGDIVQLKRGANNEEIFQAPTPRQPTSLKSFKTQVQNALVAKRAAPKAKRFKPFRKNISAPANELKIIQPTIKGVK